MEVPSDIFAQFVRKHAEEHSIDVPAGKVPEGARHVGNQTGTKFSEPSKGRSVD